MITIIVITIIVIAAVIWVALAVSAAIIVNKKPVLGLALCALGIVSGYVALTRLVG